MKDNSTGKNKEFYELGKRMHERLNPTPVQREWVETNNSVCAILRQVHDMLALASFPPKREWVGLTDEGILKFQDIVPNSYSLDLIEFSRAIEALLKEKNHG